VVISTCKFISLAFRWLHLAANLLCLCFFFLVSGFRAAPQVDFDIRASHLPGCNTRIPSFDLLNGS
jgi:hypothetical protein